jgi:rubredoxin
MSAVEIICRNCGADTLLNREAVYDGFTKTGEKLICSSCGFEYAAEADVPFKAKKAGPKIFTDADRSAKVEVFNEGENKRICRYCANYIVNPFTQFCAARKKEVQATDTCDRFQQAKKEGNADRLL